MPCRTPVLPSALPSEGYARKGGGVGFGRCPARVGVGHGQGAVRWPGNSGRLWSLRGLVAGRPAVAEPRAGRVGGRAARDPRQRVALKT